MKAKIRVRLAGKHMVRTYTAPTFEKIERDVQGIMIGKVVRIPTIDSGILL
jgi:hypothetical protein